MRILSARGLPTAIAAIACVAVVLSTASSGADPITMSTSVAATGSDQAVSTGPGDPAATSPVLACPIGIAVDVHDDLFVANRWGPTPCAGPGQILVFNNEGVQLTKRTIKAGLHNPAAVAFDKEDNLYVTDSDQHLVLVYNSAGKPLPAKFLKTDPNYQPSGVQIDSRGDVWVANRTNSNITIGEVEIFRNGRVVDKITEDLVYPLGIVFQAKTGNAWIANSETLADHFTIFSQEGRFLETISMPGFSPTYLAFNAKNGRLYATDGINSNGPVEIFSPAGKQIGSPITAGVSFPYGIAFDKEGDFFVANVVFRNGQPPGSITKYSPSGRLLCTITKSGCR
jgi:DNA-binding beta-propeller fold protein YncE